MGYSYMYYIFFFLYILLNVIVLPISVISAFTIVVSGISRDAIHMIAFVSASVALIYDIIDHVLCKSLRAQISLKMDKSIHLKVPTRYLSDSMYNLSDLSVKRATPYTLIYTFTRLQHLFLFFYFLLSISSDKSVFVC